MKPYLVDVPVKINIWIRPECQRRQFEVIRQARPSILFVQSDGGRNDEEWKAIRNNRQLIDDGIDWECKVYRLYEEQNNGLYTMGYKMRKLIWSNVDRCIFLEDDHIPSVSFFRYCAELLERYKNDQRIEMICGMNHEEISDDVNADYFFSRSGSIWGTATWKRVVNEFDHYDYYKDKYVMDMVRHDSKYIANLMAKYAQGELYEGHMPGGEFYHAVGIYAQNRLLIVPRKNMICCMGATENSAHARTSRKLPKGIRKIFDMKTYELEFPMKHTLYVVRDIEYEKRVNRIMGRVWYIKLYRIVSSAILVIKYDGIKACTMLVKRKIERRLNKNQLFEK